MGDGENEAAVEQAQAAGAEIRILAGAVGTVGVDQQRAGAATEVFMSVDQRDRHLNAVAGLNPQMFTAVMAGIETFNLLLLEHPAFTGIHIQLKQRIRRGHRGVAVAQARGFRLRIIGKPGDVGRVIKGNPYRFPGLAVDLPQAGKPVLPLLHHQPVGKQRKSFQHHVIAGRDQSLPLRLVALMRAVEAEVFAFTI